MTEAMQRLMNQIIHIKTDNIIWRVDASAGANFILRKIFNATGPTTARSHWDIRAEFAQRLRKPQS